MADQILLEGVRLFEKKPTQPDFVIATGVITPNDLYEFLMTRPELLTEYNGKKQVRIQVLKSRQGKPYISVDTWQPGENTTPPATATSKAAPLPSAEELNDLPF